MAPCRKSASIIFAETFQSCYQDFSQKLSHLVLILGLKGQSGSDSIAPFRFRLCVCACHTLIVIFLPAVS